MIDFSCECGFKTQAKDELAGKKVKCPNCGRSVVLTTTSVNQVFPPKQAVPMANKRRYVLAIMLIVGASVALIGGYLVLVRTPAKQTRARPETSDPRNERGVVREPSSNTTPPPPTETHMNLAEHNQSIERLKEEFPFVPITDWKGLKFVFLERPKSLQEYGYQTFKGGKGKYGQPTYAEAVGRIGTVIEMTERNGEPLYDISLRMDDNRQVYTATAMRSYDENIPFSSIALVSEIEKARVLFRGKSLWTSLKPLNNYDELQSDKFGPPATVKNSKYAPVSVIDVVPGWYDHEPVRFILKTESGEWGFLDCQLSGTNTSMGLRRPFEFADLFFIEDPRKLFPWDKKIWSAVENGKVFIGMTSEQARLSWGKPRKVNPTTTLGGTREQWVYGDADSFLYFDDGVLTAIQN